MSRLIRCTLLGVGAMRSPRYRPAGMLVRYGRRRIMFDGGPGAEPPAYDEAWLACDERAELASRIRPLAAERGLEPVVGDSRSMTFGYSHTRWRTPAMRRTAI